MFTFRGTAVPLFGLFDNFQVWKLHTPMDYFFFFLTIAIGVAVFYGVTQILKKYRTPEHAVQRVAKKLKKLGGNDAATYIGKTIRCGTESQPSELIALTADRIYLIHVFHYGTKAYGGVNQREWVGPEGPAVDAPEAVHSREGRERPDGAASGILGHVWADEVPARRCDECHRHPRHEFLVEEAPGALLGPA